MSGVTPFDQCVARPSEETSNNHLPFLLKVHLFQVKTYMERWLDQHPVIRVNPVRIRLYGLAGLCHDLAKCNEGWQQYILNSPQQNQGPSHAPAGAFLFSYAGYHLIQRLQAGEDLLFDWWRMTRDIADHHGTLKHLQQEHWMKMSDWSQMDLEGMHQFLIEHVPELEYLSWKEEDFARWSSRLYEIFEQIEGYENRRIKKITLTEKMQELQRWRYMTTGLIVADRFDVSPTDCPQLTYEQWKKSEQDLRLFCTKQSNHELAGEREKAQNAVIEQLKQHNNHRFYTLEMPTGYGKTVTAFKIAAQMGQQTDLKKIIYVAPYISILEQTAGVIQEAMNREAIEHHSLAVWDEKEANPKQKGEQGNQRTPISQLAVESWAHDIVCTSFQQFARAVFPKRSQDTLRRSFLQRSIVLIDEPQIFSPEGWNTFLTGLQGLAEEMDLIVVFISATMPPFEYGLTELPKKLSYHVQNPVERYRIVNWSEPLDEHALAKELLKREEKIQGTILNTIEDAFWVHKSITSQDQQIVTILVHGLMIPLHKKKVLEQIRHHLHLHRDIPLIVVSTQVLEAGVDVSFQHLARALPIMPSIIQAAGRVNRHSEDSIGQLSVFNFLRHGEKQTRHSIYNNPDLREITDQLLSAKAVWMESESQELINKYYTEMFKRNTYTAGQQAISKAAIGDWPALSQYEPFGADFFRLPLFVPWEYDEKDEFLLPPTFKRLQQEFGMYSPTAIYDCYCDRSYWSSKDFVLRKKFMALFQYYVLNLPVRAALKYASKEDYLQNRIPSVQEEYEYDYHQENGLMRHFEEMETII